MSTAFTFLTVYRTINKQHSKIYHKIDGKSPQKGETQPKKKCSTLFSAPNRTQEQRNREGGRERNRERAKARALFTQVCLEKPAQKAQAKKK